LLLSLEAAGLRAIIFAIVQTASYLLALNLTRSDSVSGKAAIRYQFTSDRTGVTTLQLIRYFNCAIRRGKGRGGEWERGTRGDGKTGRKQRIAITT